jgi:mRNA interferase RelE/StbE
MPHTYTVLFKRSAERELRATPPNDAKRILQIIQGLGLDPRPPGCKKLKGQEAYRVRQGDYRILYTIDDSSKVVEIIKIGHRSEVYR